MSDLTPICVIVMINIGCGYRSSPKCPARHEDAYAWREGGGDHHSPVHLVLGSESLHFKAHRLCGRSQPLWSSVIE